MINSVRIATTYELFKTSLKTSSILKKNGYFVAINLMQIHKTSQYSSFTLSLKNPFVVKNKIKYR